MAKYKKKLNSGYGLSSPLIDVMPSPIEAQRNPTTADNGYPIGQHWINVNSASADFNDVWVLTSVAAGLANWEPIGNDTEGGVPISLYIVDTNGGAAVNYTTIQSAIDAAQAAGVDATVYVRPGAYTENLTLYDGINICGTPYSTTTITGVHTPPATGTFQIQDCTLTSATHIFSSAVVGTATLWVNECVINCTNGYLFNLLNWTGDLIIDDCANEGTTDGVINNTGGAALFVPDSTVGAGTGNTMVVSGNCTFYNTHIRCPITLQGTGTSTLNGGCWLDSTLTTAATATVSISDSTLSTGVNAAISHGSANPLTLTQLTINSSNATPIGGAGAGALDIGNIDFITNSVIAGTLTTTYMRATDRVSPYIVGATGNYATIQAALDAATSTGVSQTVYVQPGTYTEDLTLYDLIDIRGTEFTGTTITGTHTPPASGRCGFYSCTLTDADDIFNSAAAGTTDITVQNCEINCTNGYLFNLANWTGTLLVDDCANSGTNDGFITNTGGATLALTDSTIGAGTGNTFTASGGTIVAENVRIRCPGTIGGAATATISLSSRFEGTLTTADTAAIFIENSSFSTGATAAISHGSAGALTLSNCSITSSNNPAIDGAGAGNLLLTGVEFTDGSNLAATLTLTHVAETRTTKVLAGDSTYRVDDFTADYNVIQAYADDDTATGASTFNAINADLQVSSGDGNHTPDALQASIDAIAGCNALGLYGVHGIGLQTDGSVIASTLVGTQGEILIHETDAADLPQVYAFGVKGYYRTDDAAAVPLTGEFAGVGSVVEYTTPLNSYGYGVVATRLGAGAGTAGRAAFGVAQGTQAIADWDYGLDLYNTATNAGQAYTNADIRLQNQATIAVDTEGATFSGEWACRSCDPTNTHIYDWDVDPILQSNANTGAAPTGATGDYNIMYCQDRTTMKQFILGAGQTIIAPRLENDGLLISLDLTNSEGAEYYFGHTTRSRHTFVIGTSPAFFVEATFKVADCGTSDPLWLGFRIIGAPNAAYTNYTDAYTIGLRNTTAADSVILGSNLNGTGWNYQDSGDAWTDGQTHTIRVNVSATGVCTALIDGVAPSTPLAFTFDTGDTVIPFIHHLFAAGGSPAAIHLQTLSCGVQAWY